MITPNAGPIYFDTETTGFYGPTITIQWQQGDDGAISIHEVWRTPILDTITLIEQMMSNPDGIIGFNLTFDMFHLAQTYTTLLLLANKVGFDSYPEDHIEEYALLEADARDGPCIKPVSACDLMLIARKGKYQSTMDRSDIRIRRIPSVLAWQLASELEKRIPLKDIYFARRKDKTADKWQIHDIKDEDGDIIPDFKDIVLHFKPSSALKALACDALGVQPDAILLFADISVDKKWYPVEYGFAPFATAVGKPGNWKEAWPAVIQYHINHWAYHSLARKYACKDIEYLPKLYNFFDRPAMGDDDSTLACMVATVRWHGFKIDIDGLKELRKKALVTCAKTPTAPGPARKFIEQHLDFTERVAFKGSTNKVALEKISTGAVWQKIPCPGCDATGDVFFGDFKEVKFDMTPGHSDRDINETDQEFKEFVDYGSSELEDGDVAIATLVAPTKGVCEVCDGKMYIRHPASVAAQQVLEARMAAKEIELYDKLIRAGRFHASFVIIGTLSSRMAGSDKLNAQGIKKTKEVRSKFPLAGPGYTLCGGDFKSFEVVLADSVYADPDLRRDLQTKNICTGCKGTAKDKKGGPCSDCDPAGSGQCDQSIHAIFGTFVYPGMNYVDVLNTKGTNDDKYTKSKSAVFAMLYGGEGYTLMSRLGVEIEVADKAYQMFTSKYKKVGEERRKVFEMFCSMVQPGGIGSKVEWHEPADYVESIFGFRRYFTLENQICKALFGLAQDPPKTWRDLKIKVVRRDREQTATGAVQSALFGASFQLQAANMRAAANHVIQSAGAQVTKHLQRKIWDIQPPGVHEFKILPMNIHDEVMTPTKPEVIPELEKVVQDTVESFKPRVPLIAIDWSNNLESWASK